jgi:hypothetical protein
MTAYRFEQEMEHDNAVGNSIAAHKGKRVRKAGQRRDLQPILADK